MDWQALWDRLADGINKSLEGVNRGLLTMFGNSNERAVRSRQPVVQKINALEPDFEKLTDTELKEVTVKFRQRIVDGETLDDLLPEAFAATRESGKRFLKMRHYDVQLIGGMVLHQGNIAEMVTGEGKTLVATLPAYLNALAGRGVHVVTVNDYLARRDAEWMSPLYKGLGLSVGAIQSDMDPNDRQVHYSCDITYGTNNEFGFDYLRDNMKPSRKVQAQGPLFYAIIDEVDSILIDEARTPLIISGPAEDNPGKYSNALKVARQLKRDEHFEVKEKEHTCHLSDKGVLEAEQLAGVESFYTPPNLEWPHLIDNALKSLHLYKRDRDYMVRDGEVVIIDEHTGRAMEGRQWSDGLHQAVEAKEGVRIKEETQTLATITFQNFFKLYDKISGMTGTAMTEAPEFYKIYKLDVIAIPTNKPLARLNHPDVIYATEKERWDSVVDEIMTVHKTGRPILVGTTSVEKSEYLANRLSKTKLKYEILNAKNAAREASIVAQAGRRGAVTVSTNMAGRGTDIILGGNPEAMAWADLKDEYETRLEVPPDLWRDTVALYADEMKKEGLEIKKPVPTLELAKTLNIKDAERFAKIVDESSPTDRRNSIENPQALAKAKGVTDSKEIKQLIELYELHRAARPGGLHIVGTERHESRRIDNQLRGRSGRQGDPGSSRFFLSLEDDLMRKFAGDWVKSWLQRLGMTDGQAIESKMVSRRVEGAQKKVEEQHFESRKNLLEYDEIMDTQRKHVYTYRQDILDGADCKSLIMEMIENQIDEAVDNFLDRDYAAKEFAAYAGRELGCDLDFRDFRRSTFDEADRQARLEAARQMESDIIENIEKNLDRDVDASEWNWEAFVSWGKSRFDMKENQHTLKKMEYSKISSVLLDSARKYLEKVKLDHGEKYFSGDYSKESLLAWAYMKFAQELPADEMPSIEDPEQVKSWLSEQAEKIYHQKEIGFPVLAGMGRFMPEKSADGTSPRYDRDGLVTWASARFRTEVSVDAVRDKPRSEVYQGMLKVSEDFFRDDYDDAIDAELDKYFTDPKSRRRAVELEPLTKWTEEQFGDELELVRPIYSRTEVQPLVRAGAEKYYRPEMREMERTLLLQFLDMGWKDHLYTMDLLRNSIGLRGYAQIDPKVEYKREGRRLFTEMWSHFEAKVTDLVFLAEQVNPDFVSEIFHITNASQRQIYAPSNAMQEQQEAAIENSQRGEAAKVETIRNHGKKIGRNDLCWCGSGKKYKNCHMAIDRKQGAKPIAS